MPQGIAEDFSPKIHLKYVLGFLNNGRAHKGEKLKA